MRAMLPHGDERSGGLGVLARLQPRDALPDPGLGAVASCEPGDEVGEPLDQLPKPVG